MQITIGAVSIFVAAIFAGSSLHKAKNMKKFIGIVAAYDLTPKGAIAVIAWALLAAEISAAALLLMSPWLETMRLGAAGLLLSAGLFSVYTAAIATNIMRGRTNIDCGCGWGGASGIAARLTVWHAARTGLLAAVAMSVLLASAIGGPLTAIYLALGGLCAAPFFVVYAGADTLIENWSKFSRDVA